MRPGQAYKRVAKRLKLRKEKWDEQAPLRAERDAVRAQQEAEREARRVAKWQTKRLAARRLTRAQRQRQVSAESYKNRILEQKAFRSALTSRS